MNKRFQRGLWWVKRDFRVQDNDALLAACEHCEQITALFVIEPSLCRAPETSQFHYHAWQRAAEDLRKSLQQRGATLHVICAEVVDVLERIRSTDGFDALFSHEETGSHITFMRDKAVDQWAVANGIVWHQSHQNGVIRGLVDRDKRQPVIRERLMNTPPRPAPSTINCWHISVTNNPVDGISIKTRDKVSDNGCGEISNKGRENPWPAFEQLSDRPADPRIVLSKTQSISETDAQLVWSSFLRQRGVRYSGGISSPNTAFDAGSRLSAHLAWGTISLRRVFHETWQRERDLAKSTDPHAGQWRKSLKAFQSRLHWHDHFIQRLESAPAMEFEALNPAYRHIGYGDNDELLHAWEYGRTGLPLVDACMRCLAATGFLNFRMRAMVVSAGCFGLAQSWQSLHNPLARVFLDYEPGIHLSQIQMQAGIVGINTLRVYSPHKQLLDQDPNAMFVKRWIPELREFDATTIALYNERCLGDYPEPVTDIQSNTRIIRDQVYAIRQSEAGREASAQVLLKHGSRLPGNDRSRGKRSASSAKKKPTNRKPAKNTASENQMTLDFGD